MGNHLSKKTKSEPLEVFPYIKTLRENKYDYYESEHLNQILIREIFKVNFSSHVQDILLNSNTKILDVGCGSGFWLTEMAADFPKPSYFGIDMLPVFPKSTIPSNVNFLQRNFFDGLPYENNTFDFVHMQFLLFDFTESQWETFVYQELSRVLKPGGWLEICDWEFGILNCGPTTKQFELAVFNVLKSRNINPHIILRNHSLIRKIPSFSSSIVYHKRRKYPLKSSYDNNKLGELCVTNIKQRLKPVLQGPVGQSMNIKKKTVDSTLDKMTNEFESLDSYFYVHRFYVQKGVV